ncbi:putative clathrin assembly protein At1g25240 [Nymphaea colorata]|nr:putative clathrin assembly protein At1g25240 [Nymphaea colorata]
MSGEERRATTLWRRAAAAVKDGHSLWMAKLMAGRRKGAGGRQFPDLEAAVIRATSHDPSRIDYTNAQRVFTWVRTSPSTFLRPLLLTLSRRMQRTRSWVVALKGLILIHGVFCSRTPLLDKIGRLPFDLSNFQDHFCRHARSWGYTAFVRAYFAFLDEKSCLLAIDDGSQSFQPGLNSVTGRVLTRLERSQSLLDLLLQIKPYSDGMNVTLILEAMDCVVIEIFDVYGGICHGIARVLVGIFNANRQEAVGALQILRKAASQGSRLSEYFEVCREIGVLNASELPAIEQVPADDIEDLERLIYGVSVQKGVMGAGEGSCNGMVEEDEEEEEEEEEEEVGGGEGEGCGSLRDTTTIVTRNWVVFNDDLLTDNERDNSKDHGGSASMGDPFAASLIIPPHVY